jgi:hypothetical protein
MHWLKHAFAIDSAAAIKPNPAQHRMIERLCGEVVRRGMATPALLLLEMSQPLNYVSAQFLRFIQPIATAIADSKQYEELTRFLEQRGSIEYLCRRLEALETARQSKLRDSHRKTAPKAIDLPADRAR